MTGVTTMGTSMIGMPTGTTIARTTKRGMTNIATMMGATTTII